MPAATAMSHLYGYIYCMLLSSALAELPFYGGALYLFGRSVMLCSDLLSRKNRPWLSGWGRRLLILVTIVLFVITTALLGLYPASIESSKLWVLYAVVALSLLADAARLRMVRLTGGRRTASGRLVFFGILIQGIIILAVSAILVTHLKDGWALSGGFALLVLFRAYAIGKDRIPAPNEIPEDGREAPDIRSVQAYQAYAWISVSLIALVELVIGTIYALLSTRTEWLLPSMLIAAAFTLIPTEAALQFLRRTRKPKRRDPTWMLLIGLFLCAGGAVFCGWMLRAEQVSYLRVYLCLAAVSAGGALSLSGLFRLDRVMGDVGRLISGENTPEFQKKRETDLTLAWLMGDTLTLVALTVICFAARDSLPRDLPQMAARFQPAMVIPVLLVAAVAFLSVFHFPMSARYIERLRAFLQLRESGEEHPVMQKKLESVVRGQVGQPFLTRFLASLLRPFFRYRLEDQDHIVSDVRNPILFLGNHLEVLGPILATLWFPVPVRFWAIAQMMDDRKKVTDYVYTNTFSKVGWLPVFVRKWVAGFIGWLSVRVLGQLECIPVYRDSPMKLRETVRLSIEALESGDHLMIFPESADQKYELQGIGKLSPGFVMLAAAYFRKTGKRLRMMPVYASKERKTIRFGTIIEFDPDRPFPEEQSRIIGETERQIFSMAGIEPEVAEEEEKP